MGGLPFYNIGTITAGSADSSLVLSDGVATPNIGIGWLIFLPDGPSGALQPHVVTAVPSDGEIDIEPPTTGSLSNVAYTAVRASGMDAKAIADLNTLLTSSNYSEIADLEPPAGPSLLVHGDGGWDTPGVVEALIMLLRGGAQEENVTSATNCDIAGASVASPLVCITNNNAITSFGGTKKAFVIGRFSGTPTLTHSSTLLLNNNGGNITAAAGDRFIAWSDNSTTPIWRVTIFRASGQSMATALDVASVTASGAVVAKSHGGKVIGTVANGDTLASVNNGAGGGLFVVHGGVAFNEFVDLVLFFNFGSFAVISSVELGSCAARTYSINGGNLDMALGSGGAAGTYQVSVAIVAV